MAKTITITVQLFDATLQGRRSLRLSGSTCKLGIVPRDMMKDTLANPKLNELMLDKYSFYMLLSDTTVGAYAVYIGKARSFSTRVLIICVKNLIGIRHLFSTLLIQDS